MRLNHMNNWIIEFLDCKDLSENSYKSYFYDLRQFNHLVEQKITEEKLKIYQAYLNQLSSSAQLRKLSAVNQFLEFLYFKKHISHFYKLELLSKKNSNHKKDYQLIDLEVLYDKNQDGLSGQYIALLIFELGLLPTEILHLKQTDFNSDFQILRVEKKAFFRILNVSECLLPFLEDLQDGQKNYLFDFKGRPYSRQWAFNQLNRYLEQVGYADMTAQSLREQYILRQIDLGVSLFELMKQLGLKSPTTLEKYFRT